MNVTKHVLKGRQLHNEGCLGMVPAEQGEYPKASNHERITENNDFIMDMQTGGLLERILDRDNMNNAYLRVKSNKGVGGVDKMSVDELLPYLKENKDKLLEQLRLGKYKPQPVRRVEIPKEEKGKVRKLGIPTVVDRVIQPAVMQGQADMYIAARDYLLSRGVERLSLCHWRRTKRERSLYNTLAKAGADVYAFGCGAGGHFAGISWMNERVLSDYLALQEKGLKPIMMAGHQVDARLGMICDKIISDLEKGLVDYRSLLVLDSRMEALENVLSLWRERGLMQEEVGVYHLTKAGEFWYVSLSQSLVECAQVIWDDGEVNSPVEEINGKTSDALAEVLSEFLPDSTAEGREKILKKMPMAVRMMLRKSSKEALKAMLASMPKAMREKMLASSN